MLQQFIGLISPKTKNLKRLYRLIHKTGPVDRNTLMELTGLKSATCARLIEELLQEKLIYESGLGKSKGGRKPSMYSINPNLSYVIGVDISSTYTQVLLLDLNLNILDSSKLEMNWESTAEYTLNFITKSIEQIIINHGISNNKLLGIGIGAVGPLSREQGIILTPKLYISDGWENVNIIEPLKKHFNSLVLLDNGANLAALGEYQSNYMKDVDNLIYTLSGIGIRGGIISNGEIVRGKIDVEGSFSHIPVDIHGRKCWCGSYGCLAAYSTIPSVRKEVIDRIKRGKNSIITNMVEKPDDVQFNHILTAVEQHDPLCEDVIQDAAFYFGVALSTLTHLVYPDIVVIGGALGANQTFYEVASETALNRIRYFSSYPVEFVKPSLQYHSVAVGAGSMIFNYFIE